jgi:peptide methionine sulfoxide reductase msrA/msrB
MKKFYLFFLVIFLVGCTVNNVEVIEMKNEKATFAGGCFWCIEAVFDDVPGVLEAISGYAGGTQENPTYQQVVSGTTEHRESVQVTYNSKEISYEELLNLFWRSFDPTDAGGQFADRGKQYTTAIFYHNAEQKNLAEKSKQETQKKFDKPIVTKILPFTTFFVAEEYHQDYSKKKSLQYKLYEKGSGRKDFVDNKWGKK